MREEIIEIQNSDNTEYVNSKLGSGNWILIKVMKINKVFKTGYTAPLYEHEDKIRYIIGKLKNHE